MGPWGFVGLAYGIVWGVIRYRSAQAELAALEPVEATDRDVKK